jgi:hypothetical protein
LERARRRRMGSLQGTRCLPGIATTAWRRSRNGGSAAARSVAAGGSLGTGASAADGESSRYEASARDCHDGPSAGSGRSRDGGGRWEDLVKGASAPRSRLRGHAPLQTARTTTIKRESWIWRDRRPGRRSPLKERTAPLRVAVRGVRVLENLPARVGAVRRIHGCGLYRRATTRRRLVDRLGVNRPASATVAGALRFN